MQGSEHWVFIEKDTSGLEELALKQIIETQKKDAHAGPSEKQANRDISKETTTVGELKAVAEQEENTIVESRTQNGKRAKMIASPEDFESLWDDIYDRDNRKHSSETDSQTAEEAEEQRHKTGAIAAASTEHEQIHKLETVVGVTSEPRKPTGRIRGPTEESFQAEEELKFSAEKSFQDEKEQSCTFSWSESSKEESQIIIQEHRTILTALDKEVLKITSDCEAVKTKVKLSDKIGSSATERIIYLDAEETEEEHHKTVTGGKKHCLMEEKEECQTERSDGKEETTGLADAGETRGKEEFISGTSSHGEGNSEIKKVIIESDQPDKDTEDGKRAHPVERCTDEREKHSSSTPEEGDSVVQHNNETKDDKESSAQSSHCEEQKQNMDETQNVHREEGTERTVKKMDTTTERVDMIFSTENQNGKCKLKDIETSQIFLEMEAIEITKSFLSSSAQQLPNGTEISEEEQPKKAKGSCQGETPDLKWHPQKIFSEVRELAQNKHTELEQLNPESEQSSNGEAFELKDVAKDTHKDLKDATNVYHLDMEQMTENEAPISEQSKIDRSTLNKISESQKTAKDSSYEAAGSSSDEPHELNRLSKDVELGKHPKGEGTVMEKVPDLGKSAKDKHCKLAENKLKSSQDPVLDSQEQVQDKSSNLKQLLSQDNSDSKPQELRWQSQEMYLLKEETDGFQKAVSPENRQGSLYPDNAKAQGIGLLQTTCRKHKLDLEPLKLTTCGTDALPATKAENMASLTKGSLAYGNETNEEISVASKIRMFEQGEVCNPLFDEQFLDQKKFCESRAGNKIPPALPMMQTEVQKGIVLKDCAQVKVALSTSYNQEKDSGEASAMAYLTIAQGASEGEPSQPSSWKEDISVGSEQGEGEGDTELASPDSGCEITLAEAVVTPKMNCLTGKFIKHVV